MKKTRFTEEQMVAILREADEKAVPEVAKKHGVSAQTIYAWRKHYGTLDPSDVKRLRQLEQENGRLKKMVADRDLEIDVLKEITRKKRSCRAATPTHGMKVVASTFASRPGQGRPLLALRARKKTDPSTAPGAPRIVARLLDGELEHAR